MGLGLQVGLESGTQEQNLVGTIEKMLGVPRQLAAIVVRLFIWKYCPLASLRFSRVLDIEVAARKKHT